MAKISDFHLKYQENKEFYDSDARIMKKIDFILKHKIGNSLYQMYFLGMNGRNYVQSEVKDKSMEYTRERMIHMANKRQEVCIEWFNERITLLSKRLGVKKEVIKKLTEKYTVSELEHAEWKDGEIVCEDLVVMRKPTDFRESMCSYNCGMV